MKKKYNLGFILGIVIVLCLVCLESALFYNADVERERKIVCQEDNYLDYVIDKKECSNIAQDVWVCNVRGDLK